MSAQKMTATSSAWYPEVTAVKTVCASHRTVHLTSIKLFNLDALTLRWFLDFHVIDKETGTKRG